MRSWRCWRPTGWSLARKGLDWLRDTQRKDGGWAPQIGVDQSTWVTALVSILPPEELGAAEHAHAIQWVVGSTGEESTLLYRIRRQLLGNRRSPEVEFPGWPWVPGAAAWVGPTAVAILALERESCRKATPAIRKRIADGQRLPVSRMCLEGGWNHGSVRALGYESHPYPETTGMGLAALEGRNFPESGPGVRSGQKFSYRMPVGGCTELAAIGIAGARTVAGGLLSSTGGCLSHSAGDIFGLVGERHGEGAQSDLGLMMETKLTRREWLAVSTGALCLSGCGKDVPVVPSTVSIVRAAAYDQSIYETMRRLLAEHQVEVRGRRVLLKPNLVEFEPESSINTNPLLVHAAFEAFRVMGASSVRIAEGPGHRRNTLDLADAGLFQNRSWLRGPLHRPQPQWWRYRPRPPILTPGKTLPSPIPPWAPICWCRWPR